MNTSHSSNQRVIEKCRFLIVLMMNIFLPIPHIKSGYLLWYMLHEENTNKKPTIRPRYRIVQSMNSWLIMKQSKVPAESDGKPVDEQSWFHNSNISLVSVVFIILENGLLVEIIDWAMIHSSEIFTFAREERISLAAMVLSGYSFLIGLFKPSTYGGLIPLLL